MSADDVQRAVLLPWPVPRPAPQSITSAASTPAHRVQETDHPGVRSAPLGLAGGAFKFNSGVDHLKADGETAGQLHGMTAGTYPFLARVDPKPVHQGAGGRGARGRWAAARPIVRPGWPAGALSVVERKCHVRSP
jgi:hypothetical protein